MFYKNSINNLYSILRRSPSAVAVMHGESKNGEINGTVRFYQVMNGVLIAADIVGLPISTEKCEKNIFAFHIHGGTECTGNSEDPFADAGSHYNPYNCLHPYHAGDMPPLFSVRGGAFLAFITDRFTVDEIIGKTVIVHDSLDDFTTQPSGNSGRKIACGVISRTGR